MFLAKQTIRVPGVPAVRSSRYLSDREDVGKQIERTMKKLPQA